MLFPAKLKFSACCRLLIFGSLVVAGLVGKIANAIPMYELGSMPAPISPSQMVYSSANKTLVLRNSASAISTINLTTQESSLRYSVNSFSDMSVIPGGRYLYAADYGGEIIGYSRPDRQSYVHRLDMATGSWESKKSYIAARLQAVSDDTFVLKSQDQWVTFTYNSWGAGTSVNILNNSQGSYPGVAYSPGVFSGNFRYDAVNGRLLFGNSGLSSRELNAYKIINNDFKEQEYSGSYGVAQYYGGTLALATDGSALYYGKLQLDALDVSKKKRVFPELIYAATGDIAFGEGDYYDAKTGESLGSFGFKATVYGLDPASTDFWVFDATKNMLRHFSTTPQPETVRVVLKPIVVITLSSLSLSCPLKIEVLAYDKCTAEATYSDGDKKQVSATWSTSNATALSVVSYSGQLRAGYVSTPTSATISATYSEGGVSRSASALITVEPLPPPKLSLSYLAVTCPYSLEVGATGVCTAKAVYADGTSKVISPTWASENRALVDVDSAGKVTAANSLTGGAAYVTAEYQEGGGTKTSGAYIAVKGGWTTTKAPSSLIITCPASIKSAASASCTSSAKYTDGSDATVVPTWSSSDPSVLTVDASGRLTAKKTSTAMTVVISANYVENGLSVKATTQVSITPVADPVPVTPPPSSSVSSTKTECFFAWAEASYKSLFPVHGKESVTTNFGPYSFRSYPQENPSSFLGFLNTTGHVIYLGPLSGGQLFDLGSFDEYWARDSACY